MGLQLSGTLKQLAGDFLGINVAKRCQNTVLLDDYTSGTQNFLYLSTGKSVTLEFMTYSSSTQPFIFVGEVPNHNHYGHAASSLFEQQRAEYNQTKRAWNVECINLVGQYIAFSI